MEYRAESTRLDITDGYLCNDSFPNMTTDGVEGSPLHDDSLHASPVVDSVSTNVISSSAPPYNKPPRYSYKVDFIKLVLWFIPVHEV